jgi:hypothetical protein
MVVEDNGIPSLRAYRRVILDIKPIAASRR